MKKIGKDKWNKHITERVILMGGRKTNQIGFYMIANTMIDLTASGDEDWQIARNIFRQLEKKEK